MLSCLHTAYFHECFEKQSSDLLGLQHNAILNRMSLELPISECVIFTFIKAVYSVQMHNLYRFVYIGECLKFTIKEHDNNGRARKASLCLCKLYSLGLSAIEVNKIKGLVHF